MTFVSVLLLIIKIIGIVLLTLIGIILLILIAVLFLPIKYSITANKDTADNIISARVKVTYLLHLINMRALYEEGKLLVRVRICIFKVFEYPAKKKKNERNKLKKENRKIKKEKKHNKKLQDDPVKNPKDVHEESKTDDTGETIISGSENEDNNISESYSSNDYEMFTYEDFEEKSDELNNDSFDSEDNINEENNEDLLIKKITLFISYIWDLCKNFSSKINRIISKIKDIYNNIEYYIYFIGNSKVQDELVKLLGIISKLLKHMKPRKFKIDACIGMSDPASTGQILAILSVFYPFIHNNINITPSFDEEILDFDIIIKGRIRVVNVLIAAFKIYFDKDLKKIRKRLKNKEAL